MKSASINSVEMSAVSISELYRHYRRIEDNTRINEQSTRTTYNSPVNFIESMQKPRHRWFPYKEGFSPTFVRDFLKTDRQLDKGLVVDPFSGSGTTALVAGELGVRGLGLDVSPLTDFVARAKSTTMSTSEVRTLDECIRDFAASPLHEIAQEPSNETVKRYFEPIVLDSLLGAKQYFLNINCQKTQGLFKLAFLSSIEPFSTHRKAGNGVKRKTNYSWPVKADDSRSAVQSFMTDKLKMFRVDLQQSNDLLPPRFFQQSCLGDALSPEVENVSAVLTSPPYANCFDYSKIYMSELWLGDFFTSKKDQARFREASVRSHVHATWGERHSNFGIGIVDDIIRPHIEDQDLWSPKIGGMLSGYFTDLGNLLSNLRPRMRQGARLGFVVGNSFYGGIAIATDLLIAELGRKNGYEVEEVRVYRGVIPSSQQFRRLGNNRKYMRESMVVLRRP